MSEIDLESLQRRFAEVDLLLEQSRGRRQVGMLEQLLLKTGNIKLKMYQETGHGRPHFHVDYGKQIHTASYAIDTGERIEGTLKKHYDRAVRSWVDENREELMSIWTALQKGEPEEPYVSALGGMDY